MFSKGVRYCDPFHVRSVTLLTLTNSFLQFLFPLIATSASLLYVIARWSLRILAHGKDHVARPSTYSGSTEDQMVKPSHLSTIPDNSKTNGIAEAARHDLDHCDQSQVTRSRVEINHPRGEMVLVVVELLAIVGKISSFLTAWSTRAWGRGNTHVMIVGITAWSYVLVLVLLRLYRARATKTTVPDLWNQTAILYGIQWLCTVLVFRSAIVHPWRDNGQRLTIINFTLGTVLLLIALCSRKGNKAVVLDYEGDLKPSREPLASLFSIATFSWVDAIVWHGYKKTYELADVWNLASKDKATAVLADYRQLRKTSKLVWHLVRYFKRGLLIQGAWAICNGFLTFVPTLLLKAILEYVENPDAIPRNAAWFYVVLLACSSVAESVTSGQGLWVGRKICIRLRAIIVGEIYAKALRRKAASAADRILGDEKKRNDKAKQNEDKKSGLLSTGRKKKNKSSQEDSLPPKDTSDSQVNTGTIINLMAVDSFKLAEISAYLHFLWGSSPVQLIVCILLLYRILGTLLLSCCLSFYSQL